MSAINGCSNVTSVSVYRKLNGQNGGRATTQVNATEQNPDAGFRSTGLKTATVQTERAEMNKTRHDERQARNLPTTPGLEQAMQNRINNPSTRPASLRNAQVLRDLNSGTYAGPLPASALVKQSQYHAARINAYL